jgi:antitoxin component YwqK of YwqJK toxin-antitoxin module
MRSVKLFFTLFVFVSFVAGLSCKSGGSAEKEKEDSLKAQAKLEQARLDKKKNPYLIEPPDTSYTGEYIDKYDNGNVKFRGWFRFGQRHGQWMAFYANGLLWSECFYDKGLRHGANNVYYENGLPNYKGWYKNDLRDSLWIFYDAYGNEARRAMFKNDEEVPVK